MFEGIRNDRYKIDFIEGLDYYVLETFNPVFVPVSLKNQKENLMITARVSSTAFKSEGRKFGSHIAMSLI